MTPRTAQRVWTVALVGNPNTGKSTIFSDLVGVRQRVGNYPGVTVEKKTGRMAYRRGQYTLVDLPGLYSLAPRSPDEMVAVDVLLGRHAGQHPVDAVVLVADASNLQRNLYLASQVLELGIPTVLALNMTDVAAGQGIALDDRLLAQRLGIPVVPMQANRGVGVERLKEALASALAQGERPRLDPFPAAFRQEVVRLESLINGARGGETPLPGWLVERLVLDASGYLESALLDGADGRWSDELRAARVRLEAAGCGVPGVETAARYGWAQTAIEGAVSHPPAYPTTASDRIDRWLTHRLWGTVVFAAIMVVVFQAVFIWAEPVMDLIDAGTTLAADAVQAGMAEGALRSLLADGVIAGAGGVLRFLPQILVLFFFLAVLEDCGYMARAAVLMDGLMARIGLSGKSFIPLLSSFACAIPGIMATRVIERPRDRLATILVAPLMTCSARLPVYALLIAAFIPPTTYLGGLLSLQGLVLVAFYALGIVTAVVVALILRRTLLRGARPPFVMELPSYKWPSPRVVVHRVVERAFSFVRFAGSLILAVSILVWAALYYPHNPEAIDAELRARQEALEARVAALPEDSPQQAAAGAELAEVEGQIAAAYQAQSLLGQFGRAVEPVFRPLGWDWRIGSAVMASFPAREVVVATLGVIFSGGGPPGEESPDASTRLRAAVREDGAPLFTVPVALGLMVFFALCAQCAATLAVIRRETNSWRWPAFTFAYMTALAYVGAMLTYQVGSWIAG